MRLLLMATVFVASFAVAFLLLPTAADPAVSCTLGECSELQWRFVGRVAIIALPVFLAWRVSQPTKPV